MVQSGPPLADRARVPAQSDCRAGGMRRGSGTRAARVSAHLRHYAKEHQGIGMKKILIVALDQLGDLVFASALTPPLRVRWPNAQIDVWSRAYTAPVAQLLPHVSNVIA